MFAWEYDTIFKIAFKYQSFPFITYCNYDNGCFLDTQVEGIRKIVACDENGALLFQNQLYKKK
jgi:hypothetical protein